MIISRFKEVGEINLPNIDGEFSMIPFDLSSLDGLSDEFKSVVNGMLKGVIHLGGVAFFTIHGKTLKKGETLRRGGAHTDGNYEPINMSFGGGGGGWKVGEGGAKVGTDLHTRQYETQKGGIILASNYHACLGWSGDYDSTPNSGGDCTHIELGAPTKLKANKIYYGNNHFIHESLPMNDDVHRVLARITMPENHEFILND